MRSSTLPSILANMPSEVQSAMKAVTKQTLKSDNSGLKTTSDKLFLLSEIEVLGSTSYFNGNTDGSHYAYYTNGGSTIKNYNGNDYYWWLRSFSMVVPTTLVVLLPVVNLPIMLLPALLA